MTTNTTRMNPAARGWRWLVNMGIAVPLIAGLVVGLLAFITFVSPRFIATQTVNVGPASTYAVGSPIYFEDERFWVVKLESGEMLALYDRDPLTGCTVPWDPNYETLGVTGWFRDACSRSIYDLQGACFSEACAVGLNRLEMKEDTNGDYIVNKNAGGAGPVRTAGATPLSAP
jgi:hypothetical protein